MIASLFIPGTFEVGNKHDAVSCTRLRSSIATDIAMMGKEDIKTVANAFFMHREETCTQYYIMHFKNNEAIRLSMECMRNYGVIDDEKNIGVIPDHDVQVKNVSFLTKAGYASKNPFCNELQ